MSSYNIKTDFGAVGDGVADDALAFAKFNDTAIHDVGLVTLNIPAGTFLIASQQTFNASESKWFARGIKQLQVTGVGATSSTIKVRSSVLFGGAGQVQDNAHSTRLMSVSAGASSVVVYPGSPSQPAAVPTIAAAIALFTVGQYALVTGFELQVSFNGRGYPSNPHFFEWVLITSIDSNPVSSTYGAIGFSAPLKNAYKATWPNYSLGSAFEVDSGGPATLYAIDSTWDTQVRYSGLTIDKTDQTHANGRDVTWDSCVISGGLGLVPSQNFSWFANNCDMSSCTMEVDKLVTSMTISGGSVFEVDFQNSSVDVCTLVNNVNVGNRIEGSPKKLIISACISPAIPQVNLGAYAYGRSDEANFSNSTISAISALGFVEQGWGAGVQSTWLMSGVTITAPNGTSCSSAAASPGGKVRMTVVSSAGFVTGKYVNVNGSNSISGGFVVQDACAVVDSTHIDLVNTTFSGSGFDTGFVNANVNGGSIRWAVPGTWIIWVGSHNNETIAQVLDVTQDANNTYITLDRSYVGGSWPPVPLSSGNLFISPHQCPKLTVVSCTGCDDILAFAKASPGLPIYSFNQRTYKATTTSAQSSFISWGNLSSASINVTVAGGGGTFHLTQFDNWPVLIRDLSENLWNNSASGPAVNTAIGGERITYKDHTIGSQSGDAGLIVPDALITWLTGSAAPAFSAIDAAVTVVVTVNADQGISTIITSSSPPGIQGHHGHKSGGMLYKIVSPPAS